MAERIAESELIINDHGAVYHLDLQPGEIALDVITVGDPHRVGEVSKYFDKIEVERSHREFVTHTGYIGSKRLSVVSTGIGTDNVDIVLNELDALINIDFDTRTVNAELKQFNIVRVGTSGSLQQYIPVDSLLVSTHGLGIDNLLNFYNATPGAEEQALLDAFIAQTGLNTKTASPYITACSQSLAQHFTHGFHHGITVTCPGFYAPQGRVLRLGLSNPGFIDKLTEFSHAGHQITNFEMETAGIYGLGKLLGHNVLSLNAILANRITGHFSNDAAATVHRLIHKTLEVLAKM